MTEAYPLKWPAGWPRHKGDRDSDARFKGPTFRWDRVFKGLVEEIGRIGGTHIVVSTNQPIRQDGYPYAQERNISDVGVAVYFKRNGKAMVMAQDRFWSIIGNMRSLTMAIEGLRQMERHGGATMLERAFDGFTALPPPADCWKILGLDGQVVMQMRKDIRRREECLELVRDAFRNTARSYGPGDDMDRLVKARNEAVDKLL